MSLNHYSNSSLSKVSGYALILIIAFIFVSCGKDDKTESTGKKDDSKETHSSDSKEGSEKDVQPGNDFIITYQLSGKVNGTMTMNKEGDKIKQVMNMNIMGKKTSNVTYILKDNVYSVTNFGENKFGIKTNLDDYNKTKKATGETITDFTAFEKFLEDKKLTGTESILGHNCDVYETAKGIQISVYDKRYVLKIQSPEFTAEAINMDTSPSFSASDFEVPKDVNFTSTGKQGFDKGALDSIAKKYMK